MPGGSFDLFRVQGDNSTGRTFTYAAPSAAHGKSLPGSAVSPAIRGGHPQVLVKGRSATHQGPVEAILLRPTLQLTRVHVGPRIRKERLVAIQLAAVIDEDAQAGRVIDQETSEKHFVENGGAWGMALLVLLKLR